MKIAFVLDDTLDKPDGVQQYILTLGSWLNQQGHDVHYLVAETKRRDIKNIHSLSRFIAIKFNGNAVRTPLPLRPKRAKAILQKYNFDVLHIQVPYSPLLAGNIIRAAGNKTAVVGTFHILPYSRLSSLGAWMLKYLNKRHVQRFDRMISVSAPAAGFARKIMGINSVVLPNVIDTQPYVAAKTSTSNVFTIVFLGRLVKRKGCLEFLQAIAKLPSATDIQVIIAGDGPERKKLETWVATHNLQRKVSFLGFIDEADKASLLKRANIAVFPSLGGESFGIVLLEAMAANHPVVIAGNNPGYASVMAGSTAQLIDPRNGAAFANLIKTYMYNPQQCQQAVKWQQQQLKQFEVTSVGPQIIKLYQDALQSRQAMR